MGKINKNRVERRKKRVSSKIFGTKERPRVSVFASNVHTYAQVIDDVDRVTLVSYSSLQLSQAKKVGLELAKIAGKSGIKQAVFDRGKYSYKGRVKALAEGLREGGIKI